MWALNASCTWLLHPHLATYCVEQDVHICMKLKGRERPQCQTGCFTSLLLLEQTCKMQIERQRKPPRRGVESALACILLIKTYTRWIRFQLVICPSPSGSPAPLDLFQAAAFWQRIVSGVHVDGRVKKQSVSPSPSSSHASLSRTAHPHLQKHTGTADAGRHTPINFMPL